MYIVLIYLQGEIRCALFRIIQLVLIGGEMYSCMCMYACVPAGLNLISLLQEYCVHAGLNLISLLQEYCVRAGLNQISLCRSICQVFCNMRVTSKSSIGTTWYGSLA